MLTLGPTHLRVRRSTAAPGRWRSRAALPFGFVLAAAGLSGCLEVMGDVELAGTANQQRFGATPLECDAGPDGGRCVVSDCQPGRHRCDRDVLEVCSATGKAWAFVDQCASPGLCDAERGACQLPVCGPRQYECSPEGDLRLCNADLSGFDPVLKCGAFALCNAVRGQEGCTALPCSSGERRCNGAQLEQCRADRTGFEAVEECASAPLCRTDGPGRARCAPPVCKAGQYSCNGRELRLCNMASSDWTVVERCTSAPLCNLAEGRCEPVACALGQQRCNGSVLERCNVDQTAYAPVADCMDRALCDSRVMTCLTTPAPTPDPVPPPTPPPGTVVTPYTFVDAPQVTLLGLELSTLSVPREWNQVDDSPWLDASGAQIGPRLVISTNTARFTTSFDVPGVLFAATTRAPLDAAARLAEFDLSMSCTRGSADTYEDALYAGPRQAWTNCGSAGARTTVIATVPKQNPSFVTVVIVTALDARDDVARQTVWDTFVAALEPPPQPPAQPAPAPQPAPPQPQPSQP